MSIRRLFLFSLVAVAILLATGLQTTSLINSNDNTDNTVELLAGRNVNMVSGTMLPLGDPWLQRQNEPSIAVSSRNPMHLFAAANDYRTIDMSDDYEVRGIPGVAAGRDAWIGIFQSFDGGESWVSMLLPGFPQDASQGASNEGLASPIYGFDTACDPRVCAGAEGLFYVSGIAFMRNQLAGTVFVARYVDRNNRETIEEVIDPITEQRKYVGPIEYMDTWIAGVGNPGQFIDMPNMAVDVPRGDATFGNVHLAYTVFLGNTGLNIRSRIVFVTSRDGGVTWGKPIKVTESQHIIQRPVIAIDPSDPTGNTIYVVFRRFAHRQTPGGIAFVKSIDGGMSFTKPADVAPLLCPFDQWTKGPTITSLRTNSYPTMAVEVIDENGVSKGVPYVAWAQRYAQNGLPDPDGQARIVFSSSEDGGLTWSEPELVDPDYVGDGHQFMPSMTYAGGNKTVIWYDQRDDIALHDPNTKFIEDAWEDHRHTIDVRAAEAPVGSSIFGPSILLSRYLFFMQLNEDGEPYTDPVTNDILIWQGEHNYSGLPLFHLGTKPFQGDYIAITPSPQILPPSAPSSDSWVFNTDPLEPTRSHGAWTDTRDVRPPGPPGFELWGDWVNYLPPNSDQDDDFEQQNPCNNKDTTGMRNQNIYTADLNHGVIVGSPGNSKQLDRQRAFVVFVKNTLFYDNTNGVEDRSFYLSLDEVGQVNASFHQSGTDTNDLDITVPPYSSVSCTVYVDENFSNQFAPVIVNVHEGESGPLVGRVYLNPDSENNPLLGPDGEPLLNESHKPKMSNPKIWKYNVGNQNEPNANFLSPRAQNPRAQNSGYINPRAQNPRAQNPRAQNPRAQNPRAQNENIVNNEMLNPRAQNPRAQNTALTDMTWTVWNEGNTTSAYSFNIASDSPDGINADLENDYLIAQVLVYKTHMAPIDNECELFQTHADKLIVNFTNPRAQNPRAQNTTLGISSTEQNDSVEPITFYLAPWEKAEVILRVKDPDTTDGYSFDDHINDIGGETEAEAADTGQPEPEWVAQPNAPWGDEPSYLPEIGTSATSLSFATVLEVNPDVQIPTIYNTGGGTLNYTIADDADWLSVWPLEGASEEPDDGYDEQDHTVSVDVSGLALGTYQGTITITNPYATNNPLRVSVTLIIAGPATQFVILDPADSTAGTATTVTVQAQDINGNVDASYEFAVTLNVTGSASGGGLVDIASGEGTAAINNTMAETVNLSLSDAQETGLDVSSTQDVLFIAGAAAQILFDEQPTDTHANETISPAVTVEIQDIFGNLVTTATNSVTITLNDIPGGGGGTLSGTLAKEADGGIATFDDLNVSGTGVGYSLTASSPSYAPTTSNSFNIFAKITGTVQWNGASVVDDIPGTSDAHIYGRKHYQEPSEESVPSENITYDIETGVYTVTNILPANYKFYATVDTRGVDFKKYPDNYHGEGDPFLVNAGDAVVNYNHNTQKIMHMTDPAGAENYYHIDGPEINHSVPYPPSLDFTDHTYPPEIIFDWDTIAEGEEGITYNYTLREYDASDSGYNLLVGSGTVAPSSLSLGPLSPSVGDKFYAIRIMAYKNGTNWIGKVMINWNGGMSESYIFRVVPELVITTTSVPEAINGESYTATLQAEGGIPPYVWDVLGLPTEFTFTEAGEIDGTPNYPAGPYAFLVVVEDSGGAETKQTSNKELVMTIINHTVSTPNIPNGPTWGITGISYTYNTGGATCSIGEHNVEYRFDWGDGSGYSVWSSSPSSSHAYTNVGTYSVKAQAQCSQATGITSSWSSGFTVDIWPAISGTVRDGSSVPISGVRVSALNGEWEDFSDQNGNYRVPVPYNQHVSGLEASKTGYSFSPIYQMIDMAVTDNIVGGDFTGTIITFTLTVVRDGTGSGEVNSSLPGISCGDDCTEVYDYNTVVTLTALPESGSEFAGWSGECSGTGTCQVTMTKNTTVTATFNILHTISAPDAPTGTTSGIPNTAYWYSLSNYSICSHGHIVTHQFDWGDSSQSGWISGSNASHSWSSPGIYQVKVHGKCAQGLISNWSPPLSVTINPRISGQVFEMVFYGYGEHGAMLFNKVGKSGVTIYFSGGAGTITTDTNGYYAKAVTYNWTGTVVPSDAYNYFPNMSQLPYYRTYTAVTADTASQDYEAWARKIYFTIQPSTASIGTPIYVKVRVVGDTGDPLPGVVVNWNIGANPGGVTFPTQASITDEQGYADRWISIGTAGVGYTVVADFGTTPSTSVSSVPFDIY